MGLRKRVLRYVFSLFLSGVFFFLLTRIKKKQYLITKITDPVPPADQFTPEFAESQVVWRNKHEFMKLELAALDKLNVRSLKKSDIANLGGDVDE